MQMHLWWMAFRPKTLTASLVPVMVGTALIFAFHDSVNWLISICALLGALCIQIGTNLINDAIDFKKGADTQQRLGPVRVTQSGLMDSKKVLTAASICFVLATLFGLPLVWYGGWVIVVIGLISLLCGYAYTAGPFPLAYKGLGDLFVIIFFGLVAVGGVYYLHSGVIEMPALVAGLQIGLLATSLIAINNLRDITTDTQANKKTLAVRFGEKFARSEILVMICLPFLLNLIWLQSGHWLGAALPLILIPFAFHLVKEIMTTKVGPQYNHYLAQAAQLHLFFGVLLSVGLILK